VADLDFEDPQARAGLTGKIAQLARRLSRGVIGHAVAAHVEVEVPAHGLRLGHGAGVEGGAGEGPGPDRGDAVPQRPGGSGAGVHFGIVAHGKSGADVGLVAEQDGADVDEEDVVFGQGEVGRVAVG
jgi:hypothetical protein